MLIIITTFFFFALKCLYTFKLTPGIFYFRQPLCLILTIVLFALKCVFTLLTLSPNNNKKSVAEVIESVRLVGRETGFQEEGEAEAQRLEAGFEKIRAEVAKAEARAAAAVAGGVYARKKVAFLEWLEPLFNGGHWIPDMVRAAGGDYTMAEPGKPTVVVCLRVCSICMVQV